MVRSVNADTQKKLIEFGWGEPTTAFIKEHIAEMEQMPFDGVVFNVHYRDANNKDTILEWAGFGEPEISWEALQPALADLKATRFRRFTDNFLRFNTTPAKVDWFDDFSAILHNARMVARFCKEGRVKGILFDAEAYENYGKTLAENQPVVILGNVMRGDDGARLNVKECYPLDAHLPGTIREVTWLLHPEHAELPDFLKKLRAALSAAGGETRVRLAFLFEGRAAPIAEVASSLNWRVTADAFQQLRQHPAVAGTQVEARRFEIKETRKWAKRS